MSQNHSFHNQLFKQGSIILHSSMEPFFSNNLLHLLSRFSDKLQCTSSTISIVIDHVSKCLSNLYDYKLILTINQLNELAQEWESMRLVLKASFQNSQDSSVPKHVSTQMDHKKEEIRRLFVTSFIPCLRQFFNVPKPEQLFDQTLTRNEIMAGFVYFVLRVWDSEGAFYEGLSFDLEEFYIWPGELYRDFHEKLIILHTILEDTPFWCEELEDVKNLMTEFECLGNEVGMFVYSCTFASSDVLRKNNFKLGIRTIMERIDVFLNEKMKKHCFRISEIPDAAAATLRTDPVQSLDSFVEDLEGLLKSSKIGRVKGIKILVEELNCIKSFLNERSQVTFANQDLIQISDVVYEAEYLINTHVHSHLPSWYLRRRLPVIIQKIKLIWIKLQELKPVNQVKIKNDFTGGVSFQPVRNPEVVDESIVMGFEEYRKRILADLSGGEKKLRFISIFGMPGIGKTTIAKKLYNDRAVYDHFDLRVWCFISQEYSDEKVLDHLLRNLPSKPGEGRSLDTKDKKGLEVYQRLIGRRYLIIMDDVWYSRMWDDLRRYFPDDGKGSRILLTSRIKDIAPSDSIFHAPHLLSESQCCELLLKKLFIKERCPPNLCPIAKEIASKCHGLPLAVVVVAGILVNLEKEETVWKNVERNLESYISDSPDNYMKIFELSYQHLPNNLKPCFLYLGAFPRDKEIHVREIIPLWIAQGFVHKTEDKSLECVAEEYLSDLINRSLLMITKRKINGGMKSCSIHDLLRDMSLKLAEEEKFMKHYNVSSIYEKHPHLVQLATPAETWWSISALRCRSFFGYAPTLAHRLTGMPLLKVFHQHPKEYIKGNDFFGLAHLRYLSCYNDRPPMFMCTSLENLEYLHLHSFPTVVLPLNILYMVKLRHIRITDRGVFRRARNSSPAVMNNLKSLSRISVAKQDTEIFKCSPHLQRLKCYCSESFFPDLLSLTELKSLSIGFESPPKNTLKKINFPQTIQKLSLSKTALSWENMSLLGRLPYLQVLKLRHDAFRGREWATEDNEFQELRFLTLESISLEQWTTFSDHFPMLECLVLKDILSPLQIPSEFGDITTLERIEVCDCGYEIRKNVVQFEEEQRKYGNETLKIVITGKKRPNDQLVRQGENSLSQEESNGAEDTDEDNEVNNTDAGYENCCVIL